MRVATTNAYRVLGMDEHCGIRVGCVADLAIVNGNPVDNLKVLYGLGYGFYGITDRREQWKRAGVRWTIKEGVVYDAPALLREVLWYVQQEKSGGATENELLVLQLGGPVDDDGYRGRIQARSSEKKTLSVGRHRKVVPSVQ